MAQQPHGLIVVTNNIPVNKAFEQEFEDRFSKRVHLVDKAPGFIRNEVHRPKQMKFNHGTNKWEKDNEKQGYYQIKTWWRSFEDFVAWTNSEAFRIAHNQRAPQDMFAGASHLDVHEVFLSTDLDTKKASVTSPPQSHGHSHSHTDQHKQQHQHQHHQHQHHQHKHQPQQKQEQKPSSPPTGSLPVMSREELKQFKDSPKIYVGLMGKVYDVSNAPHLYGPGKTYHCFAGRDATKAFAKVSLEEEDIASQDLTDLTPEELRILANWVEKYNNTYPVIATLPTKAKL